MKMKIIVLMLALIGVAVAAPGFGFGNGGGLGGQGFGGAGDGSRSDDGDGHGIGGLVNVNAGGHLKQSDGGVQARVGGVAFKEKAGYSNTKGVHHGKELDVGGCKLKEDAKVGGSDGSGGDLSVCGVGLNTQDVTGSSSGGGFGGLGFEGAADGAGGFPSRSGSGPGGLDFGSVGGGARGFPSRSGGGDFGIPGLGGAGGGDHAGRVRGQGSRTSSCRGHGETDGHSIETCLGNDDVNTGGHLRQSDGGVQAGKQARVGGVGFKEDAGYSNTKGLHHGKELDVGGFKVKEDVNFGGRDGSGGGLSVGDVGLNTKDFADKTDSGSGGGLGGFGGAGMPVGGGFPF